MAAILKNDCNFETTNARCIPVVLIENSDDFEQLLFLKFACYPFAQWGQREFLISNIRLWRVAIMEMAVTLEPLTLDAYS